MYSPAFSWPHSSLITNQKQPGGPSPPLAGSPTLLLSFPLFCSPRPFLESSRLSSKGSQAVTCLPDPLSFSPFFYPVPGAAPREFFASLLLCDLTFFQFAISRPIPSFSPLPPSPLSLPLLFSPLLHLCEKKMRYVFIVDIYISLLRAKTRELQIAVSRLIRFVTRNSNLSVRSPDLHAFQIQQYITSTFTRHNEKLIHDIQFLGTFRYENNIGH